MIEVIFDCSDSENNCFDDYISIYFNSKNSLVKFIDYCRSHAGESITYYVNDNCFDKSEV